MKTLLTAAQMRALEQTYMAQTGVSSDELMLRAARAMTAQICLYLGGAAGKTCVFACGTGGNGGDGYAAARMFAENGGRAIILDVLPHCPRRPDAARMRRWALKHSGVWAGDDFATMPRPGAWIDCMFGIGLDRAPSSDIANLFDRMESDRKQGSRVISCDIPSGLNADTGLAPSACVQADMTVTFEYAKAGHYLGSGLDKCGALCVRSIGIGAEYLPDDTARLAQKEDVAPACARRLRNTHKGSYGHLLVIAGSMGMAGAAAMCTQAALRSGVGLVSVACPASIVPILQILAPCAMCIPLPEENGAIAAEALPIVQEALRRKSAVVAGPGLSRRCAPEIIGAALESGLNCLLDADALNLVSQSDSLRALMHDRCLITPHPGEAARLISPLPQSPIEAARVLAKLYHNVIYKGATSVICSKDGLTLSASGSPGMARGGSGDVLSGIAGALLARGFDPYTAAWTASEAHGLAGEIAAQLIGETAMTAQDIISALAEVWKNA